MKQVVVGLNEGHDGGCAVVINGHVQIAISEERLNRNKYSAGYLNSFFYCLSALNLSVKDITAVVFSSYADPLPKGYQGQLKPLGIPENKFYVVDHHLSHAYSTYFLSGFSDALVVVIDGQGNNNDTESYYIAEGQQIAKIGGNSPKRNPAKGIGRTYEAFTNFIGWIDQEAGKTMGLAAYGMDAIKDIKTPLYHLVGEEIQSGLKEKYERGAIDFFKEHNLGFIEPFGKGRTKSSEMAAAYVQRETEEILVKLITKLVQKTGKRKLCLAGGVALNCNTNSRILASGVVDEMFVVPASSDRGQCIGNALWGYQKIVGPLPQQKLEHDYFGREYSEMEIIKTLERKRGCGVKKVTPYAKIGYEKVKNIEEKTAELLANQAVIGWFQGGSELGPRALGNRSILCDPRGGIMKDIINKKIKHREPYRPFAPSVLEEHVAEYFGLMQEAPYMLFTLPVLPGKAEKIPAVVHVDNTARIQSVTKKANLKFYRLLQEFYKRTGVPMVLNTSFNSQEPITETPGDALNTFLTSEIDYLILGDFFVWKDN